MAQEQRKRKPARRLTPELTADFAKLLRAGTWFATACSYLGINRRQAYQWLEFGEIEDNRLAGYAPPADRRECSRAQATLCHAFYSAVKRAEAELEIETVARLREAGLPQSFIYDPKGRPFAVVQGGDKLPADAARLQWFLEHRFVDSWGGRQTVRHEGPDGGPVQVEQTINVAAVVDDAEKSRAACDLLALLRAGANDAGGAGGGDQPVPVATGAAPGPVEPPADGSDGRARDAPDGDDAPQAREE